MRTKPVKPAVFVDRDRTLIEDPGYISDPDQVHLLNGAVEFLIRLRSAGYVVVVVTNQSGVARGLLTEGDLAIVHQRMRDLLRARGADVDAIYSCPYLDGPEAVREQYRRDSNLRKPKPGMLLLAADELGIDLNRSWMVGDSARDVQAGRAAGCRTILISAEGEGDIEDADVVVANLLAAADHILGGCETTAPPDLVEALARPEVAATSVSDRLATEPPPRQTTTVVVATAPTPPVKPATSRQPSSLEVHRETVAADSAELRGLPPRAPEPPAAPMPAVEETLGNILEELRIMRRERQYEDFSIGKLAGAIFEAFALCATGWGLYAWISSGPGPDPERATSATIWLLGGIVFQLMALTCVVAANKK